jgi:hypothetical protein
MLLPPLDDISQAQQERLFHIDFRLRFLGAINRNDLVSRFGIKEAAATRDITLYREVAPDNLAYDTKAKSYIQSTSYKPLFDYTGQQALSAIVLGIGDDQVSYTNGFVPSESPTQLNSPNLDTLAVITQAIHQGKAIKISYRSLSSGLSSRVIVPFALVDNGLRWHVRAYDRKRNHFADFVINRISKPKLVSEEVPASETRDGDIQWNRIVEMHIVPHPRLSHPETIMHEYGMEDGVLKVMVRAAVAGYVLRRWNVDCSETHTMDGPEIHLWLKNRPTLYGVDNLAIAPGYKDPHLMSAD